MSEHYVTFIPADPALVPTEAAQEQAVQILRTAGSALDEVAIIVEPHVIFHDCGENFEEIRCPNCSALIEVDVWAKWMEADYTEDGGFKLAPLTMPCCSSVPDLNKLEYSWPQGFSRFAVQARRIDGDEPPGTLEKLQSILACELRKIYTMY